MGGLLEVKIAAQPGRTFEDFVLEIFFSPLLAQPRLPLHQIGLLVASYDERQWAEAATRPVVGDIFRQRMQQWDAQATQAGERVLIRALATAPAQLAGLLATLRVLMDYPADIGRRVMGDQLDALMELKIDLSSVKVTETAVVAALDQIGVHLEEVSRRHSASEALERVLGEASGWLEVEFGTVQRLLRSGEVMVAQDLVQRIRQLFRPIQERPTLDQALSDLDLLITPAVPPSPDPDP